MRLSQCSRMAIVRVLQSAGLALDSDIAARIDDVGRARHDDAVQLNGETVVDDVDLEELPLAGRLGGGERGVGVVGRLARRDPMAVEVADPSGLFVRFLTMLRTWT